MTAFLIALPLAAWAGPACPDADGDTICDVDDNCSTVANVGQLDVDSDGRGDVCDNCLTIANGPNAYVAGIANITSQCDKDSDGYGNVCDGDLNQSGSVTAGGDNGIYIGALLAASIPPAPADADMGCNGSVTSIDNQWYIKQLGGGGLPGPSGWVCAGTVIGGCPPLP